MLMQPDKQNTSFLLVSIVQVEQIGRGNHPFSKAGIRYVANV
jgi:hypothetical protein